MSGRSETTGDRLPRIEGRLRACAEDVKERPYSHPIAVGWYAQDVPALVEIAKAARDIPDMDTPETDALYRALARLDSGATEGDA